MRRKLLEQECPALCSKASDWEIEEAYRRFVDGAGLDAVAHSIQVNPRTLRRAFERLEKRDGLEHFVHFRFEHVQTSEVRRIADMYRSGISARRIEQETGLAYGTVYHRLQTARDIGFVTLGRRGGQDVSRARSRAVEVQELHGQGEGVEDLARRYGVSRATIYRDLARRDVA